MNDLEATFKGIQDVARRLLVLTLRSLQFWPAFVVAAMLGGVTAYVAPKFVEPRFETSSTLIYREIVDSDVLLGGRNWERERWIQKTIRFRDSLMSRSNLTPIIEKLDLYPRLRASKGMVEAVEQLRMDLSMVSREGRTVTLAYNYSDPDKAKAVLDQLIKDLQTLPVEDGAESERTKKFLESQLETLANELAAKEKETATFLMEHPEFALDDMAIGQGTVGATIRAARKAPNNNPAIAGANRIAALRRQAQRLKQSLAQPTDAPTPATPQLTPEDRKALQDAEREFGQAQAVLEDRRQRFTERHPDVVAARTEAQKAEANLRQVRSSVKPISQRPGETPEQTRARFQQELEQVERAIGAEMAAAARGAKTTEEAENSTAASVVDLETRWSALDREVKVARERYKAVEARLFSAATAANIEQTGGAARIDIIDPPYVPSRPSARGKKRTALVAFAMVMVLGFGVAILLALVDDRMYDEYDVKAIELGPVAVSVPTLQVSKAKRA